MLRVLIIAFLILGPEIAAQTSPPSDDEIRAIISTARSWVPGQQVPEVLLQYRRSLDEGFLVGDTEVLIPELHNLPLLVALIIHPRADQRVADESLNVALAEYGPIRAFSLLKDQISHSSVQLTKRRIETLRKRMSLRHVVVDGLFIRFSDMPSKQARPVLDAIESELRSGKQWPDVLKANSDKYKYSQPGSSSCRTRIGNMGHFVIFSHPLLGRTYWEDQPDGSFVRKGPEPKKDFANLAWLPRHHGKILLKARSGEIIKVEDSKAKRFFLYLIGEVYE